MMYGLKNVDLTFLEGRQLIQIAIGIHQVIFAFDDELTISVERKFRYSSQNQSSEWHPGAKEIAARTVELLGATVENVKGQEDGTLRLEFSNGDYLLFTDDTKEYESYQITGRGETIVV
jgi:hypothetical protein